MSMTTNNQWLCLQYDLEEPLKSLIRQLNKCSDFADTVGRPVTETQRVRKGCEPCGQDGSVHGFNDVIADKNVITKIMNNSTGLQRIKLNGFSKLHLANWLLPLFIWLVFRSVLRPRLVRVV